MACRILQKLVRNEAASSLLTYTSIRSFTQTVTCAAKKAAVASKKKQLEVETDAQILCTRLCGGNIYKEGEDPVLGKDEDYPEWLWKLRLERSPIPLEELSEDDPKYWRRLKKLTMRQTNLMNSIKKF